MSDLLTVGQAATLAGVSVRTMRRRVAAGEVMTSGHGQARRIVAASLLARSPSGTPATLGLADGTPANVTEVRAAMTEDMTEDNAAMTVGQSATVSPAMTALVALVDRLTADNRELGRQLVDVSAAATLWQERARVLDERLALMPPERPGASHLTAPSTDSMLGPVPRAWAFVAGTLLAIVAVVVLLGWRI